ncbi:MAG: 50S ribosomal protein L24 [Candidatus Uhrbacteria bacterium GW2011_GWD2_52_7]|uniref:Large ribosomal subunit protein uL24 n=1 Tax=Candidatus Uhrbacteria bacterium GW2011_GWD2_52_7 TaxID=1618989 RepID=A0A0G1ZPV3_9BACT|nr:MAG: 50S ribosomal protein L24 [Candidatus Uhrbacteria bacterium GW2011_GWD2_52_7]
MKIKTGDLVRVLTGKNKGKEGKVTQAFPKLNKVVIDGVNQTVKHVKKTANKPGQRVTYFAPIDASRVALVIDGKVGRVGSTFITKDGKQTKVRVLRSKKNVTEIG